MGVPLTFNTPTPPQFNPTQITPPAPRESDVMFCTGPSTECIVNVARRKRISPSVFDPNQILFSLSMKFVRKVHPLFHCGVPML